MKRIPLSLLARIRTQLGAISPGTEGIVHGWIVYRYPLDWHDHEPYKISACDGRFSLEEAVVTIAAIGRGPSSLVHGRFLRG